MLHLLGTGAAFSDAHRTTTMLAVSDGGRTLVIDCGGDVVQRLLAAGLPLDTITGVVVTHEHPDHVGGFALMIEKLWLAGRRDPLPVYGIAEAIGQARRVWEAFRTDTWEGVPHLDWREVPAREGAPVLEDESFRVTASPVQHSVPCVGLRIESRRTGGVLAYSCDTAPCEAVGRMATGASLLVHEATGAGPGHSSAEQAAETAARAGAHRLVLVHLPPGADDDGLAPARRIFSDTTLGEELGRHRF